MILEEFYPLTPERWDDFENLFGPRGACAGCWCMYWKLPRKDFTAGQGDQNRFAQMEIVASGHTPGLLAYADGIPAGWVAVEPRESYPVLSVTCFFVSKKYRNQGLTVALLKAAVAYVVKQGGRVVEGYPVEPREAGKMPPVFVYTGLASAFKQAGFKEAGRRSETRPIMRYSVQNK
jgi:GNAT superfamily N-acetyltransferase